MNFYAIGFGAVALFAVAGADYVTQARTSEQGLTGYSASAYFQSFGQRLDAQRAEREKAERQAQPAKIHLPEAPEGWDRREWDPEASANAAPLRADMSDEERAVATEMQNSLVGQMMMKDLLKQARKTADEQVWEYVKDDAAVLMRVAYTPPDDTKNLQQTMMDIAINNMQAVTTELEGYAVVQGVPFFSVNEAWLDLKEAAPAHHELNLIAVIGRDIKLTVKSSASPTDLRMLLEAIDYDGLNMMLDTPVASVGSAAPQLDPLQEIEIAEQAAIAYTRGQFTDSSELLSILPGAAGAAARSNQGMAAAKPAAAPKPIKRASTAGDQPKRLQLSSDRGNGAQRCVGSFCD